VKKMSRHDGPSRNRAPTQRLSAALGGTSSSRYSKMARKRESIRLPGTSLRKNIAQAQLPDPTAMRHRPLQTHQHRDQSGFAARCLSHSSSSTSSNLPLTNPQKALKCLVHNVRGRLVEQDDKHKCSQAQRGCIYHPRIAAGKHWPRRSLDRKQGGAQPLPQRQYRCRT
jgi:hypothetical protein